MSQRPGEPRDERFIVLQMVQDGTITPDEGARLLESMDRAERTTVVSAGSGPTTSKEVRFVVTNASGQQEIDIVLPYGLVEFGLSVAQKIAPGRVPDTTEIRKSINAGFVGRLLNVSNGDDRIEIIVQER